MKTLTKKILTVCLTLTMACALAIPAFADFDNGYNGYHIRNESIGGNNRDLSSNNNDSVVSNAGNMSAFTIRLVNHGNVFAYVSGNNVVWGSVAHVWNELA